MRSLSPILSPSFANVRFHPHHRPRYTTLKDVFHCTCTSHRIRSMRLSRSHPRRKVIPLSHFSSTNGADNTRFSRYPSYLLRKSLLSCSFLTSYSRSTITRQHLRILHAQRRFKLFFPTRRNSQNYNLSFIKARAILLPFTYI